MTIIGRFALLLLATIVFSQPRLCAQPSGETIPPPPAAPPDANAAAAGLTLEDVEELALTYNPTLAQALAQVRAAQGLVLQAGLYPNPTISYQGAEIGNDGRGGQNGFFIGQTFVTAQKRQLAQAAARAEVQRATQVWAAQEMRVLGGIRTQFYNTLTAQREVELAEILVDIGKQGVKAAQVRFDAKAVGRADITRATAAAARAEMQVGTARYKLAGERRRLAALTGLRELPPEPLAGRLDADLPELNWNDVLSRIETESPEVATAAAAVERARWEFQHAVAQRYPNVQVQGGAQYDDSTNFTVAGVQFSVPLPIYNRNQGNIIRARAEISAAEQEFERVTMSLRHRLATEFQQYESSRLQLKIYDEQVVPDTEESMRLTRVGYGAGEYSYLTLLAAQRDYFQAALERIEALRKLRGSAVAIDAMLLSGSMQAPQ